MALKRLGLVCSIIIFVPLITVGVLLHLGNTLAQASPSINILYVAPGGVCGLLLPCYAHLQAAVDAAAPGSEIRVATGTYTDNSVRPKRDFSTSGVVTQTVYISKTVTIRGGYNSSFTAWDPTHNLTTLHIPKRGRGIYITGNVNPTIEWLRITGGDATGLGGFNYYGPTFDAGGGIYVTTATVTLSHNEIFSNTAPYGGGVFMNHSAGLLDHNNIYHNHAATAGGGLVLYNLTAVLNGNTIRSNISNNMGGGVYLYQSNSTFQGNTFSGNSAFSIGGALDIASCDPIMSGNIISGNTAQTGGAMHLWYSHHMLLTDNVIADNQATLHGEASALYLGGSNIRMLHNTLARNRGGDGSAVYLDLGGSTVSTLAMTNTLMISHTVGITMTAGSSANLNGVLWYSTPITVSGAAIIAYQYTGNPVFKADGYHLSYQSAAIDKGVQAGVPTDIDGQTRNGPPDLGADEYWPVYFYLPLILRGP